MKQEIQITGKGLNRYKLEHIIVIRHHLFNYHKLLLLNFSFLYRYISSRSFQNNRTYLDRSFSEIDNPVNSASNAKKLKN